MPAEILKFFKYQHLLERLQVVSEPFCTLAHEMDERFEAKDCFVRADLEQKL